MGLFDALFKPDTEDLKRYSPSYQKQLEDERKAKALSEYYKSQRGNNIGQEAQLAIPQTQGQFGSMGQEGRDASVTFVEGFNPQQAQMMRSIQNDLESGNPMAIKDALQRRQAMQGSRMGMVSSRATEQALRDNPKPKDPSSRYSNVVTGGDGRQYGIVKGTGKYEPIEGSPLMPEKKGTFLTVGENGEVVFGQGVNPDDVQSFGTKGTNDLEASVVNGVAQLDRLERIDAGFKPEYLQYGGQAKGWYTALKDKAGVDLSAEDSSFLKDYTTFKTQTMSNMTQYIKEISGATVSTEEREMLNQIMPSMDMSPTQFKASSDEFKAVSKMVIIRSKYMLQNGTKLDKLSLPNMKSIYNKRGTDLYNQFLGGSEGTAEDKKAAKRQAKAVLVQEFGA